MNKIEKFEKYPVLDYGYVQYLDHMGSDEDIVDAARISYDRRGSIKDRALIRYLLRHQHTSPFEMCELKLELKMPIFVARQWVRHRTASMNEVSARYTILPEEMYMPEAFKGQSTTNKQGTSIVDFGETFKDSAAFVMEDAFNTYEDMHTAGIAREQARIVLPLSTYTKMVWKIDLKNLLHLIRLRADSHAQYEIRVYADVIWNIVSRIWPLTAEAAYDYMLESYNVSRYERVALQQILLEVPDDKIYDIRARLVDEYMTEREWNEFVLSFGKDHLKYE